MWFVENCGGAQLHEDEHRGKTAYFIKSLFPSSFPLCSSPLVQAKMLAMGLVLVGLPYKEKQYDTRWH